MLQRFSHYKPVLTRIGMLIRIQQHKRCIICVSDSTIVQNCKTETQKADAARYPATHRQPLHRQSAQWCLKMQVPRQDVMVGRQEERASCMSLYVKAVNCRSPLHHASPAQAATQRVCLTLRCRCIDTSLLGCTFSAQCLLHSCSARQDVIHTLQE